MLNERNIFNPLFFSKISLFLYLFSLPFSLVSQSKDFFSYPEDTIIIRKGLLKKTYYLRGRALNLSVMKWVMQEIPAARKNIQRAVFTDQLSVAAYGLGGGICFLGLVTVPDNSVLGVRLLKYGGYTLGGGVLFQVLSTRYVKKAVLNFNVALKEKSFSHNFQVKLKLNSNTIGLGFYF